MPTPVIASTVAQNMPATQPISADGVSFSIYEWQGSGPALLHVHHQDDEAWHVLEGTMRFRFADQEVEVGAGSTVFVPAGVAHTYTADDARYLIILPPRLRALIEELHQTPDPQAHPALYRKYESALLE